MANVNTIKITQLQNIGANLNGNTLFPVVSTVGTNVTDKANLETIATFILNEAGNLLPQAYVSTFSQSVLGDSNNQNPTQSQTDQQGISSADDVFQNAKFGVDNTTELQSSATSLSQNPLGSQANSESLF